MGTVVRAKGVDGSKWASELILPGSLGNGLRGAFLFRDQMDNSLINMAPDGVQGASVVGTPSISGDGKYGIFKSSTSFVQTQMDEYASSTTVLLFRAPTSVPPTQPSSLAPILFGNYDPAIAGTPAGTVCWCPSNAGVSVNTARDVGGGVISNSGITISEVSPKTYNTWHAACFRVGPTQSRIKDFTSNVTGQSSPYPRAGVNSKKIRIGSGYQASQTGDVHLAAALYWDRELTDTERDDIGKWILAYQALMGIAD